MKQIQAPLIQAIERDWHTERTAALDLVENLRRQRGASVLDGRPFDNKLIDDAEAALDAILAAETEETYRSRDTQSATRARQRKQVGDSLTKALTQRRAAIRAAEKALKAAATALVDLQAANREAYAACRTLGVNAFELTESLCNDRMAYRIAFILQPVADSMRSVMQIPVVAPPFLPDGTKTDDSWSDADEKKIAAYVAAALEL